MRHKRHFIQGRNIACDLVPVACQFINGLLMVLRPLHLIIEPLNPIKSFLPAKIKPIRDKRLRLKPGLDGIMPAEYACLTLNGQLVRYHLIPKCSIRIKVTFSHEDRTFNL